jgi:hypothetical protein
MVRGKALVASPAALRGMDVSDLVSCGLKSPDTPAAFAHEVESLLMDGTRRAALGRCVFEFASRNFSRRTHHEIWSRIVSSLVKGPTGTEAASPREDTLPIGGAMTGFEHFAYGEWNAEERVLGRVLQHVLVAAPLDARDRESFREAWLGGVRARNELRRRVELAKTAPLATRRGDVRQAMDGISMDQLYARVLQFGERV